MGPSLTSYNSSNGFAIDAIFSSEFGVNTSSVRIFGSNLTNLIRGQFGSFNSFPSGSASSVVGVFNIILLRPWQQVSWVTATGIITRMTKYLRVFQIPLVSLIHKTMYKKVSQARVHNAVSIAVSLAKPNPAGCEIRLNDLPIQVSRKTLNKRIRNCFVIHMNSIHQQLTDAIGICKVLIGGDLWRRLYLRQSD